MSQLVRHSAQVSTHMDTEQQTVLWQNLLLWYYTVVSH